VAVEVQHVEARGLRGGGGDGEVRQRQAMGAQKTIVFTVNVLLPLRQSPA
jgi:hypothetical protein